jgi:Uma2 family endonuclease
MLAETAFHSDETFTQKAFRRWLDRRPRGDVNHYELIQGRIVMTPPAGWPHARIGSRIVRLLDQHVSANKLGIVLESSAGYDLPSGDTVEPDVSFIATGRLAAGPAPKRGQFLRIVPNLVIEILSRTTARRDRTEKKDVYASNGVDEYWLVDPDRQEVTVFTLGKQKYSAGRTSKTGRIMSTVLPGLTIVLGELFEL